MSQTDGSAGARPAPGGETISDADFLERLAVEFGYRVTEAVDDEMAADLAGVCQRLNRMASALRSALPGAAASGREDDVLYERVERRLEHEACCTIGPGRECSCSRRAILAELRASLAQLSRLRARSAPRPGGQAAGEASEDLIRRAAAGLGFSYPVPDYEPIGERRRAIGLLCDLRAALLRHVPLGAGASEPREAEVEAMYDAMVSFAFPTGGAAFEGKPDRGEIRDGLRKVFALRAAERGAASGDTGASQPPGAGDV